MIDLGLAVACSLIIGAIFKYAGQQRFHRTALLAANYIVATGASALTLVASSQGVRIDGPLLAVGIVTGALFIATFFIYALATQTAGLSLAVGVMRVSVVLPFLASWFVWGEVPSQTQQVGMFVACIAFFFITSHESSNGEPAPDSRRTIGTLALLFVAGGLVDVLLKTFDEGFAAAHPRSLFLFLAFATAGLIAGGLVVEHGLQSGDWPGPRELFWGLGLGLVNYGSAVFFLRAVRALPGPFVFPANNIAIVLGAALIGVFGWGEHLNRRHGAGLMLAAVALLLLSL